MPNIKSSKKSAKTDKAQAEANTVYTSRVKNSMKKLEKAVKNKETAVAKAELSTTIKNIDKAVSKGLMKKNTADRQKARINKIVKEM